MLLFPEYKFADYGPPVAVSDVINRYRIYFSIFFYCFIYRDELYKRLKDLQRR